MSSFGGGSVLARATVQIVSDTSAAEAGISKMQVALAGFGATAIAGAVTAAIKFESALVGVGKTTGLAGAELEALGGQIRQMSKDIPVSATELANITAIAAQLGIRGTENLLSFTDVIAKMGVATNLTGEQAAFALARIATVTQLPVEQVGNLASAIVALGNNVAATESEITEFLLRIAAAGSAAGFTQAQLAGYAATMAELGIQAEAGGTAFSKLAQDINSAVIDGGAKLEKFAEIAGMSAAEFATAFRDDAHAATLAFLTGLDGITQSGGNTIAVLDGLDISEARMIRTVTTLAAGHEQLAGNVDLSADAIQSMNAINEEADRAFASTESQLKILRNTVVDLGIDIGGRLIPALQLMVEAAGAVVTGFGKLPDSTQNIVLMTAAVATMGPLVINSFLKMSAPIITATQYMSAFGFEGLKLLTTAQKMTLGLTAVGLAFIAIDFGLQAITGKGLLERIGDLFEDVDHKADGLAEGLAAVDSAMRATGDTAAEVVRRNVAELVDELDAVVLAWGELSEAQRKADELSGAGLAARFETLTGLFEAQVETLLATTGGYMQLVVMMQQLPPAFQDIIRNSEEFQAQQDGLNAKLNAGADSLDQWAGTMLIARGAIEETTEAVADGIPTFEAWRDAIVEGARDAETGLLDVEKAAKLLDDALQDALDSFTAHDRAMLANEAAAARLQRQVDALTYGQGELDEATQAQVDSLNDQIDALLAGSDAADSNKDALEGVRGLIDELTRPGMLAYLIEQLQATGLSFDETSAVILDALVPVLTSITDDDIPATITAVQNLGATIRAMDPKPAMLFVAEVITALQAIHPSAPAIQAVIRMAAAIGGEIGYQLVLGVAPGLQALHEMLGTVAQTLGTAMPAAAAPFVTALANIDNILGRIRSGAFATNEGLNQMDNQFNRIAGGGGGGGGGGGSAAAAAEAIEEVTTSLGGFLEALAGLEAQDELVARFGEIGGELVAALLLAMEEGAEGPAGEAVIKIFEKFREFAINELGPMGGALAESLLDAIALAMEGSPEGFAKVLAVVEAIFTEAGIEAAVSVADAFAEAAEEGEAHDALVDSFGELGADAIEALGDAAAKGAKDDAGPKLYAALDKMLDEADKKGLKHAPEIGKKIIDLITRGLAENNPALLEEARRLIESLSAELEEGAEEPARTLVEAFIDGFEAEVERQRLEEIVGKQGADLMLRLAEAIEEGDDDAIEAIGAAGAAMIAELADSLAPGKAEALFAALFAAIKRAIEQGGGEALEELKAILAEIEALGNASSGTSGGGGGSGNPATPNQQDPFGSMGVPQLPGPITYGATGTTPETTFNRALSDDVLYGVGSQIASAFASGNTAQFNQLVNNAKVNMNPADYAALDAAVREYGGPSLPPQSNPLGQPGGTSPTYATQAPVYTTGGTSSTQPGFGYEADFGDYPVPILDRPGGSMVTGPMLAALAMNRVPEYVMPVPDLTAALRDLVGAEAGERGGDTYSFNPSIVIQGNADGDDLKRALNEWWSETKRAEHGVKAAQWGAGRR